MGSAVADESGVSPFAGACGTRHGTPSLPARRLLGLAAFVLCCSDAAPSTSAQSTSIVIEMKHPFCPDVSPDGDAGEYEGDGYLMPTFGEAGCCGQVCTLIPTPNPPPPNPNPKSQTSDPKPQTPNPKP